MKTKIHFALFLFIFSPLNFSNDNLNIQKELISFFDYFDSKDMTDRDTNRTAKQYVFEKCSGLSFVFIGGDTEGFDVGDAFFEEAITSAGKDKRPLVYQNIQEYGSEYIVHFNDSDLPDGELFTELMKDDMAVCLEFYEGNNLQEKYEGRKDSKLIE